MERNHQHINQLVDHLFRHESGKMVAVLSRLLGLQHIEHAQDIVQDTLLKAMNAWRFKAIPANPSAWLYKVARNKAIDLIRREKKFREIGPQYQNLLQSEWTLTPTINNLFLELEIRDSQLAMMFACCHPSIPPESQVALTLKTLCGLDTGEIAKAFLTSEDTIRKRIWRAKEKIKEENIEMSVPSGEALTHRLDTVLKSIYLLFNEGYNSSHPEKLIRAELCEEGIRLCQFLALHPLTRLPRTHALLSLMYFQSSRLWARMDDNGNIILLKYQDRTKWRRDLISKGFECLEAAAEPFEVSVYHLEAAIASRHAAASSFEHTDWIRIYDLYEMLYRLQPGPVVAMNMAIASAYAINRETALASLLKIKGLEHYYLYHTSVGEIYFELNNKETAKKYYQSALQLASTRQEKELLKTKIRHCENV